MTPSNITLFNRTNNIMNIDNDIVQSKILINPL
jgi:hypothetical protein